MAENDRQAICRISLVKARHGEWSKMVEKRDKVIVDYFGAHEIGFALEMDT
jgi:uncharacterized protein with HEPN domain